ncbi:unnamed protein product [Anisakis simplex]|uniref:PE family protein n=1 Tax=Anisakis simplex TaxID=6269 RepID=A0A0M3KJ06_ANISI|nr:unnamed protein product [Anisakis simplex]
MQIPAQRSGLHDISVLSDDAAESIEAAACTASSLTRTGGNDRGGNAIA